MRLVLLERRRKKCEVAAVVWSLSCSRAISRARSLASLLASARFCFTLLSSAVGRPVNLLDELFRPNKINLLSTKCEGGRETSRCRPSAPHDACSIAFYHRRRFDLRFTICLLCFMPLWRCSFGLIDSSLNWNWICPIDAHFERGKRQFIWSIACTGMPSPYA